jgi:hypothetical protein
VVGRMTIYAGPAQTPGLPGVAHHQTDQTSIRLVARYDIQAINPAANVKMIGVTA